MKLGSRNLLLKQRPRRVELVRVPDDFPDPELSGAVYRVRALSAAEKSDFDGQFLSKKGELLPGRVKHIRLLLLIETVVDETGAPLFTRDDLSALQAVDAGLIELLVNKAQELNRFTEADIEDLEKNSGLTTAAG